jgi:hypothetical protein
MELGSSAMRQNRSSFSPTRYAINNPPPIARLFLLSEEFASVIHVLGRETGQLSPLLRCAWDGGDLCAHDGHRYVQATAAHISIVGHVTQSDLAYHLSHTGSHNGFANRCLWTSVRRSKSLPDSGSLPPEQQSALARELHRDSHLRVRCKKVVHSLVSSPLGYAVSVSGRVNSSNKKMTDR